VTGRFPFKAATAQELMLRRLTYLPLVLAVLAEATPGASREDTVRWYRRAEELDPGKAAYRRALDGYQGGGA
jgi:hypothetical protein